LPEEGRTIQVNTGQFTSTASLTNKGFVKLVNNNYFSYSNGESYNAIGMNNAHIPYWTNNHPMVNYYELYFKRLSENGGNFMRIWINFIVPGALKLWGVESCNYYLDTYNLRDAFVWDKIIEKAEEYNIKLQICLFAANNFDEASNWESRNTYNKNINNSSCTDIPGICNTKDDFFTNTSAIKHQKNYIKYIIDRYGYSSSVMIFELFNEVDQINLSNPSSYVLWHSNMKNTIKSHDRYGRSVTTSFAGTSLANERLHVFQNMDIAQIHRYLDTWGSPNQDGQKVWFDLVQSYKNTLSKPVMIAEGNSFSHTYSDSQLQQWDPNGFVFHNDAWATILNGSYGNAMHWKWYAFIDHNSTDNQASDFMKVYKGISNYEQTTSLKNCENNQSEYHISPDNSNSDNLSVYYKVDIENDKVWGWVQDDNFRINNLLNLSNQTTNPYLNGLDENNKPNRASTSNSFTLSNLPTTGNFKISWFNTETGEKITENYATINSTQIELTIPSEMLDSKYGDAAFLMEVATSGWKSSLLVPSSSNTVLEKTVMKLSGEKIFYVRKSDGMIHHMYKSNKETWVDNWLTPAAPRMKSGTENSIGMDVVPENNDEVFYIAYNRRIYNIYFNGSNWSYRSTNSSAIARNDSELHYGNGQIFYVDTYGRLHVMYKSGSSWAYSWLNGNAPKVKPGTGFELIPELNNTIYYVAENNRIYKMYWNNGWKYEVTNSSAYVRSDSKLKYGNGQIFYIDTYGRLHVIYKNGSSWSYSWLNGNAPKVKSGTGFELLPELNNTIFYVGEDNNIYKMYWTNSDGWLYKQYNLANSNSGGGKSNHNILFLDENIFYIGRNDSKIHRLQHNFEFPFTVSGSTIGKANHWDVKYTDGADVAYKFYVDEPSTVYATTSSSQTTIKKSKIELFDINKNSLEYKYIGSPTSSNKLVKSVGQGYYYIVVDGYDEGNFKLSVNNTSGRLKSTSLEENEFTEVENRKRIEDTELEIYPNPAQNNFNIILPDDSNYRLDIIDIDGKILKTFTNKQGVVSIDCSNLNSGIYLVQASSSQKFYQQKIAITK
jgi:hypothetical protein